MTGPTAHERLAHYVAIGALYEDDEYGWGVLLDRDGQPATCGWEAALADEDPEVHQLLVDARKAAS